MTEEELPEPEPVIPGVARALSPLVRRILANNPGVMTGTGTNTYLVGIDEIVVIDPGPVDDEHLRSITGCGGDRIRWIICTSDDPEHAGGTANLKKATGAKVLAAPGADIDADERLVDGDTLMGTEFRLTTMFTPGPSPENVALLLPEERLLFAGDLVVEGSTVALHPPRGDLAAYLESLATIRKLRLQRIAPAHGHLIEQPAEVIDQYLARRAEREEQIVGALGNGANTVDEIVTAVYPDLDPDRVEPARHMTHANLLKLAAEKRVKGGPGLDGTWKAT